MVHCDYIKNHISQSINKGRVKIIQLETLLSPPFFHARQLFTTKIIIKQTDWTTYGMKDRKRKKWVFKKCYIHKNEQTKKRENIKSSSSSRKLPMETRCCKRTEVEKKEFPISLLIAQPVAFSFLFQHLQRPLFYLWDTCEFVTVGGKEWKNERICRHTSEKEGCTVVCVELVIKKESENKETLG